MMACMVLVLCLTACASNASDTGTGNSVQTVDNSEESTGVQPQEVTDENKIQTANKENADLEVSSDDSKATNTSAESWMNMQQKLTLWIAQQHEPSNVIPFPQKAVDEG